jgi:hypothetical protein
VLPSFTSRGVRSQLLRQRLCSPTSRSSRWLLRLYSAQTHADTVDKPARQQSLSGEFLSLEPDLSRLTQHIWIQYRRLRDSTKSASSK